MVLKQKQVYKEIFYPSFRQAVFLIVATIILDIVLKEIWDRFYMSGNFVIDVTYAYIVIDVLIFAGILYMIHIPYRLGFKELFDWKSKKRLNLFIAVTFFTLGGRIFANDLYIITTWIYPVSNWWIKFFSMTDYTYIQRIILFILMAPIIEEILFRGIIFRGFLKHYSLKNAIILSSLLFAIAHLNVWQGISAFILGIVYAWIYKKTKSLIPCIFSHALHNFLVITTNPFTVIDQGLDASISMIEKIVWIGFFITALIAGGYLLYMGNKMLDEYSRQTQKFE